MKLFFAILFLSLPLLAAEPDGPAARPPEETPKTAAEATPTPKAEPAAMPTTAQKNLVILGVIDRSKKQDFDTKIVPVLESEIHACSDCQLKNYSSYDAGGNFVKDASFKQQLDVLTKEAQVIFINFNEKVTPANQIIVDELKAAQASGHVIVIAAGQPGQNESSAPLSMTIAGQVPNALVIGELGEHDRLLGSSYFGPEMLTAIRPPKDQIGQGVAPAIFAGRLAKQFHKKTDWVKYLNERKLANKRLWLELNDCFRTL